MDSVHCVICQETTFLGDLDKYKRCQHFGCQCQIYFHPKCWDAFIKPGAKCPFCRKTAETVIQIELPPPPTIVITPVTRTTNRNVCLFTAIYTSVVALLFLSATGHMIWLSDYTIQHLILSSLNVFYFSMVTVTIVRAVLRSDTETWQGNTVLAVVGFYITIHMTVLLVTGNLRTFLFTAACLLWLLVIYLLAVLSLVACIAQGCERCLN